MVSNAFERHAQTALVLLLVALLIWVGKTTQETAVAIAELKVEMEFLRQEATRPHDHGDISGQIIAIRKQIEDHIRRCEAAGRT